MKSIKKTLKNKEAFTLMEMVLVLFIISVLMLMIIPNVANTKNSVETKGTDALAVVVQTQADMYELDTGTEAASFHRPWGWWLPKRQSSDPSNRQAHNSRR